MRSTSPDPTSELRPIWATSAVGTPAGPVNLVLLSDPFRSRARMFTSSTSESITNLRCPATGLGPGTATFFPSVEERPR